MNRRIFLAAAWLVVLCCPGSANEPLWKSGAAKVCITPDQPVWMAGYASRTAPADGKLTDLWAKALVLEDHDGSRGVIITVDLVGIDRKLSSAICVSLNERYGLTRDQVVICCSHTHSGPVVMGGLAPLHYLQLNQQHQTSIAEWTDTFHEDVVDVVGQAIGNLQPSHLTWGSGTATFATNRRENAEGDVPNLRSQQKLKGPQDHDVPVLAVRNLDKKLTAVLFGYACHATTLSLYQWSGDYPGFAQIELEEAHSDCVAMFFAGCGADQNPLPRRTTELARHYGRRLASAVDAVLMTTKMQDVTGSLNKTYTEIDLPLGELPDRDEIVRNSRSTNRYEVSRAKMLLEQIDRGVPLSPTYPYPVGVWSIGDDVQFVALGGEVVVDYANRLKSELSGKQTWVAGYANDVMAYIPSRRVLGEGGYEGGGAMVYYGLPAAWAPDVERVIVDEVHRQVGSISKTKIDP
ncbi:Neutral ceramidase precursor [Rubripirellula lacrimiformis]|uniref:Neutral ceramidase n=1 Tax=Rubripirellula lacrimiformis TaxID=1930273 RepID=A0A517NEV4_9BACT|nr:neutral/alkaline non-lysosomal ceramidase N-terminal domain-containing protein [Rubripirellula lacrimiformis]QDT05656.1 Neutral ceramidase precursor [Rubripirellula lacrimiformis]